VVLHVRMPPAWEQIKPLREFCVNYARTPLGDKGAESAGLVVSELLENATKYGDVGARIELTISMDWKLVEFCIRVVNQAQLARIRVLEREFSRTQEGSATDAFAQAVQRLRQQPQGTAMLGLARVVSAATVTLDVRASTVTMNAQIGRYGVRPGASSGQLRSVSQSRPRVEDGKDGKASQR
jgi:hypothetical protein